MSSIMKGPFGGGIKMLNPIYAAKSFAKDPKEALLSMSPTAQMLGLGEKKRRNRQIVPSPMPAQSNSGGFLGNTLTDVPTLNNTLG